MREKGKKPVVSKGKWGQYVRRGQNTCNDIRNITNTSQDSRLVKKKEWEWGLREKNRTFYVTRTPKNPGNVRVHDNRELWMGLIIFTNCTHLLVSMGNTNGESVWQFDNSKIGVFDGGEWTCVRNGRSELPQLEVLSHIFRKLIESGHWGV